MVMPFVLGACSALRFTLSAPILKWDEERSYVYWNEVDTMLASGEKNHSGSIENNQF